MQRILVIGSGGAGKSTFSARLSAILGLPVIHLDREFWQPGWIETPKDAWAVKVQQLCDRARWIMDGNYGGTLEARIAACDTIVFLDLPRWVCFLRVLRRNARYWGRARPDMNDGCPERFPRLEFLRWILAYPATRRPKIKAMLGSLEKQKKVVVLSSRREVATFLHLAEQTTVAQPSISEPR